jgi:predicted secreted Zn-dependent protease
MKLFALPLVLVAFAGHSNAADWAPIERTVHYTISGSTAPELYASIGEAGPLIGKTRTIALTNWELKWSRQYEPRDGACVLVSAKPFLTITYSLPKPAAKLSGAVAGRWKIFMNGITAHEKVHGADIAAMVDQIIAATVGLHVENDPQCKAIRVQVLARVKAANEAYKAKSRTFDNTAMSDGGTVQQLILELVNG